MGRNSGGHDFGWKQLKQESWTEAYGTLEDMVAAYVRLPSIQARLYKVSMVFFNDAHLILGRERCLPA